MADIFDKIASGINKGVATVGAGSKAMVEKAKIKTVISNLEAERKQLAELLGMKVYEKFAESGENPGDESIANFVTEIKKRLAGIAEQQAELKRIEMEMSQVTGQNVGAGGGSKVCACGNANGAGAKFCAKCGNAL